MDFHLVPRGTDRNYTGFLTKTIAYTGSLILFLTGVFRSIPYHSSNQASQGIDQVEPVKISSVWSNHLLNRRPEMDHLPK